MSYVVVYEENPFIHENGYDKELTEKIMQAGKERSQSPVPPGERSKTTLKSLKRSIRAFCAEA